MPLGGLKRREFADALAPDAEVVGQSGSRYHMEKVLQERGSPAMRVYRAIAGTESFVLKDVPGSHFDDIQATYRGLRKTQFLRVAVDAVPERSMFVYRYLSDHLLHFAQKELPRSLIKRILKDALRGLLALHDQDLVHTDVKANNILVDWENGNDGIIIKEVQLADIEDATYLGPRASIVGLQVGNQMWRSPEAHTQAPVNKPSDIFSFGIVCIYAVSKKVIFAVDEESLGEGEESLAVVLARQISYFADEVGLTGFYKHLGESHWRLVLEAVCDEFNKANPRKPVSLWQFFDDDFRDLITGLTKFDPAKRLTAKEALEHRWFSDVN